MLHRHQQWRRTSLRRRRTRWADAVRLTWRSWPRSKVEASKCVVPVAASISPLRTSPSLVVLPYAPLRCKPPCAAALNPYARVDFAAKIWICPLCFSRNHFPPHYAGISEANVPASSTPSAPPSSTRPRRSTPPRPAPRVPLRHRHLPHRGGARVRQIRHAPRHRPPPRPRPRRPRHVRDAGAPARAGLRGSVQDLRVPGDEGDLQGADLRSARVGGRRRRGAVAAGFPNPKGLPQANGRLHPPGSVNRFLLPASDCEYTLNSLLDELQTDQWPVEAGNRALRCTGVALSVAAGLLGACVPGTGARIIALVGGPCTEGPGMIVSKDLSEPVRSHKDLDKDAAPHFHKAGHVLDLFASALDQVGVAEMKVAVERTGGLVVLSESFGHSVFKDSFKRIFEDGEQSLGLSFNGTLEINCSKDIKIQGVIGPCTSLEKKGALCSDSIVGQGNTTAWKMCGLDRTTSLTVFF
uniref:Protein transport protein SEC23 n=1 Tax=Ananas comosus var. bracteatus TaxID=296719 RepID=A0A6V7P0V8_ANACO|nr:unnamed protein product [Ananas comosus var. bracteatus]